MLALLLALPPAALQQVHVVDDDGGPGLNATSIQAAVDAASEGDSILVRDGAYGRFEVVGKSLSIVGDVAPDADRPPVFTGVSSCSPGACTTNYAIRVRDTSDEQQVVLSNLETRAFWKAVSVSPFSQVAFAPIALVVADAAGPILTQAVGTSGEFDSAGVLYISRSDRVVCIDSSFLGTTGPDETQGGEQQPGVAGGTVVNSTLALFDCSLIGSSGFPEADLCVSGSRPGIAITSSEVLFKGCEVKGGAEVALLGICGGALGAPPIFASADSIVWPLDGTYTDGFIAPSTPTTVPLDQAPLNLDAPAVARDDTDVTLTIAGSPGAALFLLYSAQPATADATTGVELGTPRTVFAVPAGT